MTLAFSTENRNKTKVVCLNTVPDHWKMDNIKICHHYFKWNSTSRIYVQIYLWLFFFSKTSLLAKLLILPNEEKFCGLWKDICLHAFFLLNIIWPSVLYFSLFWGFPSNFIHFYSQRKTDVFPEQNGFPNLSLFSCLVLKYVCLSLFSSTSHFLVDQSNFWNHAKNIREIKEEIKCKEMY